MSAVLTGLALATSIAREATDGIPVAKQVLGVTSRIVGLAEQIDKNRDDLRDLADRAKKLDATISAIVADRELDAEILCRLEGLNGVLGSIEKHFANHIKQSRVRKTLGYIFTVRKDVDRLKGDFDNRLRELELAANLNTNIVARENSRFTGEFRNIRHCEVTLLRPIASLYGSAFATCEGSNKVFIVRNMLLSGIDKYQREWIEDHNRTLEHMSLLQNRHPTIACLYGRNLGPICNRFVVLEAGKIRPLWHALTGTADIAILGQLVAKLVVHKPSSCISNEEWLAAYGSVFVDDNYKPTIGINDDLRTVRGTPEFWAGGVPFVISMILDRCTTSCHSQEHQFTNSTLRSTTWCKQMFGALTESGSGDLCRENIVQRADISSLIPLSQDSCSWMYLHQADRGSTWLVPGWGVLLLRLVLGSIKCDESIMGAWYRAHRCRDQDAITVYCVEADDDLVFHRRTCIEIPGSAVHDVRQKLGIPVKSETECEDYFLQRSAGAGATSIECAGWSGGFLAWVPW